jgi:hypothetical protein
MTVLIVLGLYLAGVLLYEFGRSKGYREGFTDGSGYRWGADSPGDLTYRKD